MTATADATDERTAWLAERRTGIGGSDASAILGVNRWKSAYTLWAEKCGLLPDDGEESEPAEWGKRLESAIAAKYADVTGRFVHLHGSSRPTILRHAARPYMIGSLDADVSCAEREGPGILEIKTTGAHLGDEWEEAAPLGYQVQLQHYMAVTGRRWGSFAVLIGGQKFRWYDVERNDTFIATLEVKCEEFWRLVETRTPPDIDATESTAAALKKLYPQDTGEAVDLGIEAVELVEQLEAAKAEIAAAEARKREIDNRIRAAIGSASFGVVPGVGQFSLKTQRREAHTVEATEFRALRFTKAFKAKGARK